MVQALFANSDRVNSQSLPDIINAPGLPLPPTNTLLTANAQFRRDGDDPSTIAGSAVPAEPVVPVPSGVPLPAGAPEVRYTVPVVSAMDTDMRDGPEQAPKVAPVPTVHSAADIGAPGHEHQVEALHDEVDVVDDVPFIPPP